MLNKIKHKTIFITMLLLILVNSCLYSQRSLHKTPFRESTFDEFAYPNGIRNETFSTRLQNELSFTFPKAKKTTAISYITQDSPKEVVNYYSQLSGQRFFKNEDHFIYIFSEVNGVPACKIEIYPIHYSKIHKEMWPTRIDLCFVSYPITVSFPKGLNRNREELKKKVGRLFYDGELKEDAAMLEMEELGSPDAEVYIVSTKDPFEQVYSFFRRRYGRIYVVPARDGDVFVRDFEFDATHTIHLDQNKKELYIRVEENPLVTDQTGNSQVYHGYTFIKYIFWKNTE